MSLRFQSSKASFMNHNVLNTANNVLEQLSIQRERSKKEHRRQI